MTSRSLKLLCLLAVAVPVGGTTACIDLLSDPSFFVQEAPGTGGSGGTGGAGGTTIAPGCIASNGGSPVGDECGVFVSSSKGDDANTGTKEEPFATIAKAHGAAKGKPVYLCGETFVEAVEIAAGAQIYGALDCEDGWKYVSTKRSNIAPGSDAIPLRVASKVSVELDDVNLTAANASVAGGSSIGLFAEVDADVSLVRSVITTGNGAAGTDGALFDMPATAGGGGLPGNDACTAAATLGGSSVQNACDADSSVSGGGGNGQEFNGGAGSPGLPDGAMNAGAGEGASACTAGAIGDAGMSGDAGPGASGLGSLMSDGFQGVAGGNGQPGKAGQGGGGGGGAKGGSTGNACNKVMGAAGNAGASGASGGAGGCGGLGGKGGGAGGSSIGILTLGAKLTFETVNINTANGGKGGNGGPGQDGGDGGQGAAGGQVPAMATDLKPGCAGGPGGKGGAGGKGGGGLGGHSIGIAHTGAAPDITGVQIVPGTGGNGGDGEGDMGAGAAGVAAPTQAF